MKTTKQMGISPAPWGNREGIPAFAFDANLDKVANCYFSPERGLKIAAANARLIAAAPELYAALRDCVTQMCEYCRKEAERSLPDRTCENGCAVMLAAKAALEKAGGAA